MHKQHMQNRLTTRSYLMMIGTYITFSILSIKIWQIISHYISLLTFKSETSLSLNVEVIYNVWTDGQWPKYRTEGVNIARVVNIHMLHDMPRMMMEHQSKCSILNSKLLHPFAQDILYLKFSIRWSAVSEVLQLMQCCIYALCCWCWTCFESL